MMFVTSFHMAESWCIISNRVDRTGARYGFFVILEMLYSYKNGKTYARCRCDCGTEVIKLVSSLLNRNRPSCGCMRQQTIIDAVGIDVTGRKFNKLTVLEMVWERGNPSVKCKCDCGNTVVLNKSRVMTGHTKTCGCSRRKCTTTKDFTGYISPYGIEMLEQDILNERSGTWIWKCRCGVCGSTFKAVPYKILNGLVRSCGCLRKSSREILIEKILKKYSANYKTQYIFKDCKFEDYLKFDFAVLNEKYELSCLIEYDGEQHFLPIFKWGGEDALKANIIRDEIKNKYCLDRNIRLFRLPYTLTDEELINEVTNIINP